MIFRIFEYSKGMPDLDEALIEPIGVVTSSPYQEKWGTPRQGGLTPDALVEINLDSVCAEKIVSGLTMGQRVGVLWYAHLNSASFNPLKARIKPPKKLDGRRTVGVFATRGVHRPSSIGLSFCSVVHIEANKVTVAGGDMILGTPVLNIIKSSDLEMHRIHAQHLRTPDWINIKEVPIRLSFAAYISIEAIARETGEDAGKMAQIVRDVLKQDPRSVHSLLKHVNPVYEVELCLGSQGKVFVIYRHSVMGEVEVIFLTKDRIVTEHRGRTEQWLDRLVEKVPFIG